MDAADADEYLSRHFRLGEMLVSTTAENLGIELEPPLEHIEHMRALAANVLEPLREIAGCPLVITSGWRSAALNRALGGASQSQHLSGMAADVVPLRERSIIDIARQAVARVPFDQMIIYRRFLHVSYDPTKPEQRGEVMTRLPSGFYPGIRRRRPQTLEAA